MMTSIILTIIGIKLTEKYNLSSGQIMFGPYADQLFQDKEDIQVKNKESEPENVDVLVSGESGSLGGQERTSHRQ